jgi:methyl coenzyme M reductase subunit C-like uncharacterized protein (methanogenesis marker protein 7)
VHPRAIDRCPWELKVADCVANRAYVGRCGELKRRHRSPEAVRAEQCGPIVEKVSGRGIVEKRRPEGVQPTVTDVEGRLARIEQEDPI